MRHEDGRQPELSRGAREARPGPPPSCGRRAPRAARRAGEPPGSARARARARRAAARRRRARAPARRARPPMRNRSSSCCTRRSARGAEADVRARRRGAGRARTPGRGSRPDGAPAAGRRRRVVSSQVSPSTATCPLPGVQEPGDDAQRRRLPRAGRPDQRERLAALDASARRARRRREGNGCSRSGAPSGEELDGEQHACR